MKKQFSFYILYYCKTLMLSGTAALTHFCCPAQLQRGHKVPVLNSHHQTISEIVGNNANPISTPEEPCAGTEGNTRTSLTALESHEKDPEASNKQAPGLCRICQMLKHVARVRNKATLHNVF